jgi:hypothetical protein
MTNMLSKIFNNMTVRYNLKIIYKFKLITNRSIKEIKVNVAIKILSIINNYFDIIIASSTLMSF